MTKLITSGVLILGLLSFGGCAEDETNNAGSGALLGGLLGATAGGIIGHQSRSTGAGMLLGGALGAASGAVIGSQVPKEPPPPPMVVEQPVMASAPVTVIANSENSMTVNVPNNDGSYTPVNLQRSGSGFVGPQGEYYSEFPTVSQLKAMYGK